MTQHRVSCAAVSGGCTATLTWTDDEDDVDPRRMAGQGWQLVDDLWACPCHGESVLTGVTNVAGRESAVIRWWAGGGANLQA